MQFALVVFIVLLCLFFVFWRIFQLLNRKKDICCDCELKKNCKKFCDLKEKH
jgi:hypothetical protein